MSEEAKRFFVAKASGSRFAYVVDGFGERKPKRFDVLKGDGWADAERLCAKLNLVTAPEKTMAERSNEAGV